MTADPIARFRALHQSGCFILPNPWDVGSARLLARLDFEALASTSAGAAWTMGMRDGAVTLDGMLEHLRMLVGATDLPVNADFGNGFADEPEAVAANVARAVQTGVAGLSIEDATRAANRPLYEFDQAVARIAAARAAIDRAGSGALLTARCEAFLFPDPSLKDTLERLRAFARAGADCLYAPGVRSAADIAAVVEAADGLPVNVLISTTPLTVNELAALGVRRVSVGGALARAAWGGFLRAVQELRTEGRFQPFEPIAPFDNLNTALEE